MCAKKNNQKFMWSSVDFSAKNKMSSRQSLGGSRVVYMAVNLNRTPTYGRMQRLCEASETVSLWTATLEIQSRPPVKLIFP